MTATSLQSGRSAALNRHLNSLSLEDATSSTTTEHRGTLHRLNRLELEHTYLTEQNTHLAKELSFARCTITALRNITHQKESSLAAARQELERAYFRIRMLSMTLARQEQRLREQQQQQQQQQQHWDIHGRSVAAVAAAAAPAGPGAVHYLQQTTSCSGLGPLLQRQPTLMEHEACYTDEQEAHPFKQQLTPPESPRSVVGEVDEEMCDKPMYVNAMVMPGSCE